MPWPPVPSALTTLPAQILPIYPTLPKASMIIMVMVMVMMIMDSCLAWWAVQILV